MADEKIKVGKEESIGKEESLPKWSDVVKRPKFVHSNLNQLHDKDVKLKIPVIQNDKYDIRIPNKVHTIYTNTLNPKKYIVDNSNKKVSIIISNKNGRDEWIVPKEWLQKSKDGMKLAIPSNNRVSDIIVKRANESMSKPGNRDEFLESIKSIELVKFKFLRSGNGPSLKHVEKDDKSKGLNPKGNGLGD